MATKPLSAVCTFPTMEKRASSFRPQRAAELDPPRSPQGTPLLQLQAPSWFMALKSLQWVFYKLDVSLFLLQKTSDAPVY